MPTTMAKLLKERLKTLLDETGQTARAVSMKATGKPDVVRDILRGKVTNARADTVIKLAQALNTTTGFLTGEMDLRINPRDLNSDMITARVVGVAQAGAFMDIDAAVVGEHFDPEWVPTIRDPRFPDIEPIAFEVVGDSVDRVCRDGGHAICVPFDQTGLRLRPNMWVIAERRRDSLVERTVKQVKVVNGGYQLHPDSTNKKHQPITFPSAEPSEEVTVIAVVLRFLSPALPV